MKKFFVTLALVVATATAAMAQVSVGAGYLNTNFKGDPIDGTLNGFYAGGDYNINIVGGFSVAPGLYYHFNSTTKDFAGLADATWTSHSVNVPINLNYALKLGPVKVGVFAGPTLSLGLASTIKVNAGTSISVDAYKELPGGKPALNRFDLLLGGGVAAEISCVRLSVGYNIGMLNQVNSDHHTLKKNELHAGIAYLF